MSKRLQVVLDEAEYAEIQRTAKRHRMTVSEWVRQSLRDARADEPAQDPARKLWVVREAAAHRYPTADIDEMLDHIVESYLKGDE